ncbi:MAG: ATP-binding protein [Myxococcota bacterium]
MRFTFRLGDTMAAAERNLPPDRTEVLEPLYALEGPMGTSAWTRAGVRRSDNRRVVVTILVGSGTERAFALVQRFLRPRMGTEVVELRPRGDDLYVVWKVVGDTDLRALQLRGMTPEEDARARAAAHAELDRWHSTGRSHGRFVPSGVRFDAELRRAWFVAPDLRRVAAGLQLSSADVERRALDRVLQATPRTGTVPTVVSQFRAPAGRRKELAELLDWATDGPETSLALIGEPGIGKSTLLRAFESELRERGSFLRSGRSVSSPPGSTAEGCLVVSTRPSEAPDLRWLGDVLDQLASEVLALPPLVSRRIGAESIALLGPFAAVTSRLSPGWRRVWSSRSPDAKQFDDVPSTLRERAWVRASSELLQCVAGTKPVVIVLDDVDRVLPEVNRFLSSLRQTPRPRLHAVVAMSPGPRTKAKRRLELLELEGDAMEELVAEVLHAPRERVGSLARALENALGGNPLVIQAALHVGDAEGWISREGREFALDLARLSDSLRAEDGPLPIHYLRSHGVSDDFLGVLALSERSLSSAELMARTGVTDEELEANVRRIRGARLLQERDGRLALLTSVSKAVTASLAPRDRRRLHRIVADRLGDADADATERSVQIISALAPGDVPSASDLRVLVAAATSHLSAYATSSAARIVEVLARSLDEAFSDADVEATARAVVARWALMEGQRELAERALATIPSGASAEPRSSLHRQRVVLLATEGDYAGAYDAGMQALGELGIAVEWTEGALEGLVARVESNWDRVQHLPPATAAAQSRQALLASLLPVSYVERRDMFPAIVAELSRRVLDEGYALDSVRGLTTLAQLACVRLGEVDFGVRLGRLAFELTTRVSGHRYQAVVCSDLANFILPWGGYFDEVNEFNRVGRRVAAAVGEAQYGGYLRMHDTFNRLAFGDRLAPLLRRIATYRTEVHGNVLAMQVLDAVEAGIQQARRAPGVPVPVLHEDAPPMVRCLRHLSLAYAAWVHRDATALAANLHHVGPDLSATEGWVIPSILYYYLQAVQGSYTGSEAQLAEARQALQRFERRIDHVAPLVLHVRGLEEALAGHPDLAFGLLERCVGVAEALDFLPVLAMAAEDASLLAGREGFADSSLALQRRAARAYHDWGIGWKAKRLGYGAAVDEDVGGSLPDVLHGQADGNGQHLTEAALAGELDQLRSEFSATICEVAVFRNGVIRMLATADGTSTPTVKNEDFNLSHPRWAPIHVAANEGRIRYQKPEWLVPLQEGADTVVLRLVGPFAEPLDQDTLAERSRRIAVWAELWSISKATEEERQVLLRLLRSFGEDAFLVAFDGEGRSVGHQRFPLPAAVSEATRRALESAETLRIDVLWDRWGDGPRSFLLTAVPCPELPAVMDDVEPLIWLARDRTHARLEGRIEAAESEVLLLRRLAGGCAHDLANLFSVLRMNIQSDVGDVMVVHEALDSGLRLATRVNDLASGKLGTARGRPLDLAAHLRVTWSLMSQILDANTRAVAEIPDEPVVAIADPGVLDRVVLNLLVNARQALRGRPGRVSLRLCSEGDRAVVELEDTGGGIPPEVQGRLFEVGVSGSGASGLGLGIVRQEVEAVGGEVSFESRLGEGTSFQVRFQLAAQESEESG